MSELKETKCLLSKDIDFLLKQAAKGKRLSKTMFVSLIIEDYLYRKFRIKRKYEITCDTLK